ncbi:unnamed protein product [Agarophyton chilense]
MPETTMACATAAAGVGNHCCVAVKTKKSSPSLHQSSLGRINAPPHAFINPLLQPLLSTHKCSLNRSPTCSLTTHPLLTSQKVQTHFLRTIWGKKPHLLRNLLPVHSLSPDELAGLSCDLPSRIIRGRGDGETEGPYTLEHGPFTPDHFATLPEMDWTLLVDQVNHSVPKVADLLDSFSFLPNWRFDDVMISYAPKGGSVGPHVDNYDVFLLQTSGSRLWKTSYTPISTHEQQLVPGLDVQILRGGFKSDEQWVLEPGDALYVPPRFPHHGISLSDDCITYSLGFRAPSLASLLSGWVSNVVQEQRLWEQLLHEDGEQLLPNISDPARLTDETVQNAFDTLVSKLREDKLIKHQFRKWFATHISQLAEPTGEEIPDENEVKQVLRAIMSEKAERGLTVRQREGSVFIYACDAEKCCLYIDGEEWDVQCVSIARFICERRSRKAGEFAELCRTEPSFLQLLQNLLSEGHLYVVDNTYSEEAEEDTDARWPTQQI